MKYDKQDIKEKVETFVTIFDAVMDCINKVAEAKYEIDKKKVKEIKGSK